PNVSTLGAGLLFLARNVLKFSNQTRRMSKTFQFPATADELAHLRAPLKTISIVTGTRNEVGNVGELLHRVWAAVKPFAGRYEFELVIIDNDSTDGTQEILRRIAADDERVKVILNTRNFGHIRSPIHGLFQARGDAVILLASDLQDPPELIPQFIARWEEDF